jgi:outer membrane murein-binding lipoprotein Lpp
MRPQIVPGARFGAFTVLADAPAKSGHRYAVARCHCGDERTVRAAWLPKGDVTCPKCHSTSGQTVDGTLPPAVFTAGSLPTRDDRLATMLQDLQAQVAALHELVAQRLPQPQPKVPGLKNYKLDLDPTAVTAAGAAARLAALPANAPITKDSLLAGCSSKEEARKALDDNQQRALELAALPFAERTPALKEELRQRMVANAERLHGRLPTDPGYTDIATHNRTLHRAFADWDRDTSKD